MSDSMSKAARKHAAHVPDPEKIAQAERRLLVAEEGLAAFEAMEAARRPRPVGGAFNLDDLEWDDNDSRAISVRQVLDGAVGEARRALLSAQYGTDAAPLHTSSDGTRHYR